ncbi:tetratricopeptide repeat protein [Cellulomonas hominis]
MTEQQTQYDLAAAYLEVGRPDLAMPQIQDLLGRDPEDVRALLLGTRALSAQGRGVRARAMLDGALRIAPQDPDVLCASVEVDLGAGRQQQALSAAQTLVGAYPQNAAHWLLLARAQVHLDRLRDAQASLARALELAPDDPQGHVLGVEIAGHHRPRSPRVARREAFHLRQAMSAGADTSQLVMAAASGALPSMNPARNAAAIRLLSDQLRATPSDRFVSAMMDASLRAIAARAGVLVMAVGAWALWSWWKPGGDSATVPAFAALAVLVCCGHVTWVGARMGSAARRRFGDLLGEPLVLTSWLLLAQGVVSFAIAVVRASGSTAWFVLIGTVACVVAALACTAATIRAGDDAINHGGDSKAQDPERAQAAAALATGAAVASGALAWAGPWQDLVAVVALGVSAVVYLPVAVWAFARGCAGGRGKVRGARPAR